MIVEKVTRVLLRAREYLAKLRTRLSFLKVYPPWGKNSNDTKRLGSNGRLIRVSASYTGHLPSCRLQATRSPISTDVIR
jgi:hypothetical protein